MSSYRFTGGTLLGRRFTGVAVAVAEGTDTVVVPVAWVACLRTFPDTSDSSRWACQKKGACAGETVRLAVLARKAGLMAGLTFTSHCYSLLIVRTFIQTRGLVQQLPRHTAKTCRLVCHTRRARSRTVFAFGPNLDFSAVTVRLTFRALQNIGAVAVGTFIALVFAGLTFWAAVLTHAVFVECLIWAFVLALSAVSDFA
jgi:hypothetical protein